MSIDETMVVVGIFNNLVREQGSPEIALSIACPENRIVLNRVLFCVGSEKALFEKGGLSSMEYNEILTESNSAFTPRGKKKDVRKLIEEIVIKNKDIIDERIMAILIGGEEALTAIG